MDARVGQAQLAGLHLRTRAGQTGLRAGLGGQRLVHGLCRQRLAALQAAHTGGVGQRLARGGLGLQQGGARRRQFGFQGARAEPRQQLTLLHPVARLDEQFVQALAADLGAHHHLLPGRHAAGGAEGLRPGLRPDGDRAHRQCGPGGAASFGSGRGLRRGVPVQRHSERDRGERGKRHAQGNDLGSGCHAQESPACSSDQPPPSAR
jgi:hypothetical protein